MGLVCLQARASDTIKKNVNLSLFYAFAVIQVALRKCKFVLKKLADLKGQSHENFCKRYVLKEYDVWGESILTCF